MEADGLQKFVGGVSRQEGHKDVLEEPKTNKNDWWGRVDI